MVLILAPAPLNGSRERGMLIEVDLVTHAVPAPLHSLVASAHGYAVPANPTGHHRGLPSRHLTLVIELLAPLVVEGLGATVQAHAVVGGLHTRAAQIDATRAQEGLQYELTPPAAQALLGVPAGTLQGCVVDLRDVVGSAGDHLDDALHHAPGWRERFALVDAALLRRLSAARPGPSTSPEVAEAWRLVFVADGRVRIGDLAAHVGWSRRHLGSRFRLATGLTPQEAVRVARFEAARRQLLRPDRSGLADVAAACGYADQPHLAREWKRLAGCTIGTWLAEELPFVQDTSTRTAAELSP
ncbi:MAG: helix-turn-helix transcriptional regulator [Mycobacteriaceae bacterium]